ncbi:hypothetical protein EZS27_014196 [termite gut metagenome]|uniref:Uncharacterized protein n=1 Tax=termite gut metagenome TaxID=433724 RepID=A0A5J4RXN1_9ZZZZ
MRHTIKVREQKTIVAESFADYHKQIDDIRLTLHPGEKLIVAVKIIAIAVIVKATESSEMANDTKKEK